MDREIFEALNNGTCTVRVRSASASNGKIEQKRFKRLKGQIVCQRFFLVLEGETTFYPSEGDPVYCRAGDLVYLPPDTVYESEWEDPSAGNAAYVFFDLFLNGEPFCFCDRITLLARDSGGEIGRLMTALSETFARGGAGDRLYSTSLFFRLLYLLASDKHDDRARKTPIGRAVAYLEDHYTEPVDLEQLAADCALCPSAFRKHFVRQVGMPPIRYKNTLLVRRAKELLATGLFTVSEVASLLKQDDLYYFSRLFKQFTGVAPGQYKRACKPGQEE